MSEIFTVFAFVQGSPIKNIRLRKKIFLLIILQVTPQGKGFLQKPSKWHQNCYRKNCYRKMYEKFERSQYPYYYDDAL